MNFPQPATCGANNELKLLRNRPVILVPQTLRIIINLQKVRNQLGTPAAAIQFTDVIVNMRFARAPHATPAACKVASTPRHEIIQKMKT